MTTRRRKRKRSPRPTTAAPPHRRSRPALWVVLAVVLAAGAWSVHRIAFHTQPAETANEPEKLNVLLIVVDTLRADRLGCYGSDLGTTPHIDALAAEAVRFEHAYAHSPWTLPSVASIFTSLPPPVHGAGGHLAAFRRLPEQTRTVAECFRDAGYATGGVINVEFLTETCGMTQGFEHVDFEGSGNVETRTATRTTDAALKWLRQPRDRPFFLFVHYFDPHLVYDPPPEFRRRFAAPEDRDTSGWIFGTVQQMIAYRGGKTTLDAATIGRLEGLHNGEVAYTDQEVGRLLMALGELQLAESTIVVFTADHGEEFLDHGGFEHGHTLYDELVHIPLLIRLPGRLAPGVVETTVRHIDVTPTLCALTGVEGDAAFAGRSLLELIAGIDAEERPVVFEGNLWGPPYRGWLHGGYKLILDPQDRIGLFNVRSDPREETELSEVETDRLQGMMADLKLAFKDMASHRAYQAAPVEFSPEELQRLRSLGYVQ